MGLRTPRLAGYVVALLSGQRGLFNQWNLHPRKPVSDRAMRYIDQTLYAWKLRTLDDEEMKYKYEKVIYAQKEVEQARLVLKNNNGLAFLSDLFSEMYPQVTFIGMVRHPLALYESHKRRGLVTSEEQFIAFYQKVTRRVMDDACRMDRYHLIRFEDILADPLAQLKQLYTWTGLDIDNVQKIRLKAKPHFQAEGHYGTPYHKGQHYWFAFDEVHDILEPRVNTYQMERIGKTARDRILAGTEDLRQQLGYE